MGTTLYWKPFLQGSRLVSRGRYTKLALRDLQGLHPWHKQSPGQPAESSVHPCQRPQQTKHRSCKSPRDPVTSPRSRILETHEIWCAMIEWILRRTSSLIPLYACMPTEEYHSTLWHPMLPQGSHHFWHYISPCFSNPTSHLVPRALSHRNCDFGNLCGKAGPRARHKRPAKLDKGANPRHVFGKAEYLRHLKTTGGFEARNSQLRKPSANHKNRDNEWQW